ncbi:MAG: choice-of-anchor Q domain-containing protein [Solirubrobacterales bacterium]
MNAQTTGRRGWKALLAACAAAIAMLGFASTAFSDNFTVDSNGNASDKTIDGVCMTPSNVCTLRAALEEANANTPQPDTIDFALAFPTEIQLPSALPDIADDVTIHGPGASQLAIDGANSFRVISQLGSTSVTISGLTIRHGRAPGPAANVTGGGIVSAGDLTLDHVVVTQNIASGSDTTFGGGIYFGGGTLTLTHSTVSDNHSVVMLSGTGSPNAYGGGIYLNGGTLVLDHSTVSGNHASSTVTSPVSPSHGAAHGGGIYADGEVQMDQSTISGNASNATGASDSNTANGGGLAEGNNGHLTVTGSTFSDNALVALPTPSAFTDGANITVGPMAGTFESSIVANPVGNGFHDCNAGSLGSNGYNLDEDDSCGFDDATDLTGDPKLGSLADNGGATRTQALAADSPAIDQGKSFGATTDQRGLGYPRISDLLGTPNATGDGADIGAFELDLVAPPTPVFAASTPKSPANNNQPKLHGLAETGSFVRIYKTAGCTGVPAASGFAGAFKSPGITVSVPNNSTTVFRATATDASHNTSACSNGFTYVEDSTPPITTIDSLTVIRAYHRARVTFSSNESGSTFKCQIDGGALSPCASPKVFTNLAPGSHTVRVVARDRAGNVDATPAQRTFTL